MKAIKDLGLEIPKDISVVGFDDIPLAEYTTPPLTTIKQDFYERGIVATNQLLKMINNSEYNKVVYVDFEIKIRDSVATL